MVAHFSHRWSIVVPTLFTHIYVIPKIYEKCVDPTTILSEEKVVVFLIFVIKQRVVSLTEVLQQL